MNVLSNTRHKCFDYYYQRILTSMRWKIKDYIVFRSNDCCLCVVLLLLLLLVLFFFISNFTLQLYANINKTLNRKFMCDQMNQFNWIKRRSTIKKHPTNNNTPNYFQFHKQYSCNSCEAMCVVLFNNQFRYEKNDGENEERLFEKKKTKRAQHRKRNNSMKLKIKPQTVKNIYCQNV